MDRRKKEQIVQDVRERLSHAKTCVVARYRGLTVSEMNDLRCEMRRSGADLQVVKNTLARRAVRGTDFEPAADFFSGPTVLASSEDPVAPSRVLSDFSEKQPFLEIVGGVLDARPMTVEEIRALAKLPSREALLAKLLGTMMNPVQGVVRLLAEVPGTFVRVLDQVRQQKEACQ